MGYKPSNEPAEMKLTSPQLEIFMRPKFLVPEKPTTNPGGERSTGELTSGKAFSMRTGPYTLHENKFKKKSTIAKGRLTLEFPLLVVLKRISIKLHKPVTSCTNTPRRWVFQGMDELVWY